MLIKIVPLFGGRQPNWDSQKGKINMVPNGTTRALRCSSNISSESYTTTTNYESLCSSHAHPLGAGAANMSLRSPLSAWTFAFALCLSLLLMHLVLKCLQHRSVVRMPRPAGVNTGNSRRAPELRLRWDEVGERVKLEQILGARCRYGIDRGLRVMQGGPKGQSVSDCGVRGREE